MSKASWDPAGLARAQVLDADEPGLQARARSARDGADRRGRRRAGQADAPDPAVSAFAASGARSLVYSGDGTGSSRCARSIAADAGAGLVSTPQGRTLFLVTEALHRSGSDQPQAAGGSFVPRTRAALVLRCPGRAGAPNARAVPQRDAGGGAGIARRRRAAALYRGWRPALAGGDHHGTGVAGCRRLRQGLRRAGRKDAWTGAGGPAGISLVAVSAGRNAGRRLELARARADRRARSSSRRAVSRSPSRTARLRPSASSRRRRRRRSRTRQAHPVLTPAARCARRRAADLSAGPGVPGMAWRGRRALLRACPVVSAGPGSGARAGWCWPAPSCCSRPTAAPALFPYP